MNSRAINIFLILSVILLTGCHNSINSTVRATGKAQPSYVQHKNIQTDSSLSKKVHILNVAEDLVSGNILRLQATVQNSRKKSITLNYIFEWYDANGIIIPSTIKQWKSIHLRGAESRPVVGIAPSPNAVDFVLKIAEK